MMDKDQLLQTALETITHLNARLEEVALRSPARNGEIAIIGMACRFPGADTLPQFWDRLLAHYDAVSHYPRARLALLGEEDEALEEIHGGYLDDIDLFDPALFHLSPREAKCMDPQQRLLLMATHQALEDAGIREAQNFRRTGVFISHYASQYLAMDRERNAENALFMATGNAASISANRISYHYDLEGPSLVVDTACSSSLAGLDLACRYLRDGRIDYALVGAVSLNLNREGTRMLQHANMLSPDGRCKTFDSCANGYVPGEGVGMIVLTRAGLAEEPPRKAYAVIKACHINHDGRSNGLTAPNGLAQEAVIKTACREAGISPAELSYVETHGTGTYLGDPVEIEALGNAVGLDRNGRPPCILGCLKTNIGHLEPAAGIAGIIKAALCIQQGKVPGNNHLQTVNPLLNIDRYGFLLPQQTVDWPGENRLAGISSFGFGGVNGFAILAGPGERQGPDLKDYPVASFNLRSYWLSPARAPAVMSQKQAFLAYRRLETPTELFRASFLIEKGDLKGIEDTGNFHIGFYLEALTKIFAGELDFDSLHVEEIAFLQPLQLSRQTDTEIQVLVQQEGQGYRADIHFRYGGAKPVWGLAARAKITGPAPEKAPSHAAAEHGAALKEMGEAEFYRLYEGMGMPGSGFVRAVRTARFYQSEALSRLELSFDPAAYRLGAHPGFLDAVVQPAFLMLDPPATAPYMTTVLRDVTIHAPVSPKHTYTLKNRILSVADDQARRFSASWSLHDEDRVVCIACGSAELVRIAGKADLEPVPESGEMGPASLLHFIAERLETSPEQVRRDAPLPELGMDSLMMMKLRALLDQCGKPVPHLFDVTVNDLLRLFDSAPVAQTEGIGADEDYRPYLRHIRRELQPYSRERRRWLRGEARPGSRLRLYCFAYGHMSATGVFRQWIRQFPEDIEVVPVELPGHGDRLAERPIETAEEIASVLTSLVKADLDKPYAIFGHSSGALIAYAWALHLQKNQLPLPQKLIVSAFTCPTITPNPVIASAMQTYREAGIETMPRLSDILDTAKADLAAKVIGLYHNKTRDMGLVELSPDLVAGQLHGIVSIMNVVGSFDPAVIEPLPVPLFAFHGQGDREVSLADMQAWRILAAGDFSLSTFQGDHLFLHADQSEARIVACLRDILHG
ncbi:alpha/beta fold hydrolase [Agrobacterium vitis]|uniref:alpha/beta fold hydrolase n=1 Tax=Agrobacterium vitis TaxID=373 RepID=UPI000871FA3A|nr:alpha/beta fold hydrolase [Agrobacterium vitis]MCE6078176.1 alpha/beta fold hydrolase [Agrobacterium vitis]MUO73023.1 alpha/beta fold hydrolase [Agrobacterium vitis]MUO87100.1 alpha/beta fold hydrolase [Agrobacterium vitis]